MPGFNQQFLLEQSKFKGTFMGFNAPGTGFMFGFGTTVGSSQVGGAAVQGWGKGAIYIDTDASSGAQVWVNAGTSATASWVAVTDVSAANTWALLQTFATGINTPYVVFSGGTGVPEVRLTTNLADALSIESTAGDIVVIDTSTGAVVLTISTDVSLKVTTADKLLVGGVIVPQSMVLSIRIEPHASLKTRQLYYAQTDAWTVTGIVYEPDIAEGTGSVVCMVCKCTGNNVAVAATTPMLTSGLAVTGTAGTPVVGTLTATGADLVLAATNKIGCIFTGGDEFLDTGAGNLYIKMKRS